MSRLNSNDIIVLRDLARSYDQCLNSRATGYRGDEWVNHWKTIDCDGHFLFDACVEDTNFMKHVLKTLVAGLACPNETEERKNAEKACMIFQKLYNNDEFKQCINSALNNEEGRISSLKNGSPFSSVIYAHAIIQEARSEYSATDEEQCSNRMKK